MIKAEDFITQALSFGYTFFTGVPCSLLTPLINYVIQHPDLKYVMATNEGEATGIAAGAHIAGFKTVVMCQNSGLGNAVNPLTSLNFPFRIPTLLVVTLRGEQGLKDEPQHELMGEITGELLNALRIKWEFFPHESHMIKESLERAEETIAKEGLPYAFVMKKGVVEKTDLKNRKNSAYIGAGKVEGSFKRNYADRMLRFEAIKVISNAISYEDAIVATTGKIGRELCDLGDKDNQLYVVGSMGCASGIGFGIQYTIPQKRVIVLDGDGAALMKMGTLATIGYYHPSKLIHIILDNEAHESTGGQFTVSSSVDFCNIASACGYEQCYRVDNESDLSNAVNSLREVRGPSLIHVKVACCSASELARPALKPFQVKERFMKYLRSN